MDPAAPHPAQGDGAGAAIAFRAAFLGADAALLKPQIVQKRGARVKTGNLEGSALPPEADRLSSTMILRRFEPGSLMVGRVE